MSEWTPGPWEVDKRRSVIVGDAVVAQTIMTNGDGVTARANAHLIAAAPDLYEALEALMTEWPADHFPAKDTCLRASAALDKARGETQ